MYDNTEEMETVTESQNNNNELYIAPHTENELDDMGHNQDENHEQYDDDISIENGSPEDMHITIHFCPEPLAQLVGTSL